MMDEFYLLKNDTRTLYFATRDMPTLLKVLTDPKNALAMGISGAVTLHPADPKEVQSTRSYDVYQRQGLDHDGIRELGELEQKMTEGTEDDIVLEQIPGSLDDHEIF